MYEKKFMMEAIALSQRFMEDGKGGPFGAVVVKDGEIIGRGSNRVTANNDPTALIRTGNPNEGERTGANGNGQRALITITSECRNHLTIEQELDGSAIPTIAIVIKHIHADVAHVVRIAEQQFGTNSIGGKGEAHLVAM